MQKPYRPKIKVVHLVLSPEWSADLPEDLWNSRMSNQSGSIACWRRMAHRFASYSEKYSYVNRTDLPVDTCAEPGLIDNSLSLNLNPPVLSYGHYGAYAAHRSAITEDFTEDFDAILIIEGDTMYNVSPEEMADKIYDAYDFCISNDGRMVTFADVRYGWSSIAAESDTAVDFGDYKMIDHFMPAYCYLVMKSERESIQEKIQTTGWHAWDIWMYWNYDRRSTIFATKEQYVFEFNGASMIDYVER